MATEASSVPIPAQDEVKQQDQDATSDSESGTGSDGSSESDDIEWLAAGRERRTNQGNRYAALLGQEQDAEGNEDDELNALFLEEGIDNDFEESGSEAEAEKQDAADDDASDSDTDREDQGPAAGEGDLEGERQLAKEEKAAKRAQKRKADQAVSRPRQIRKKVEIDESASAPELQERKLKKSERVSWVPTDAPTRTSSRTLAVQNKERTTASLRESAAKRLQAIAIQQAAKKRKDAVKARPKTQAERLAEAAETERINSKSLNRWEEMEKDRVKKQKARLEALHNRKIDGPFIRFSSSKAEWHDERLAQVGKFKVTVVEKPPPKPSLKVPAIADLVSHTPTTERGTPATGTPAPTVSTEDSPPQDSGKPSQDTADPTIEIAPRTASPIIDSPSKDGFDTLMAEAQQYASKENEQDARSAENASPPQDVLSPAVTPGVLEPQESTTASHPPADNRASPAASTTHESSSALLSRFQQQSLTAPMPTAPALPLAPREITHSTRNHICLLNFSATTISHPSIQRHILLGTPLPSSLPNSKPSKTGAGRPKVSEAQGLPKPVPALCAITGQPARYRDPLTGLPYLNRDAFRRIRATADGGGVWSDLLGAWVGAKGEAARGVPEGFLGEKVDAATSASASGTKVEAALVKQETAVT